MHLPQSHRAVANPSKIRDYLLSSEHPVGRFKSAFFNALGYSRTDWKRLQADLIELGSSGIAIASQASAFGQKYEVRGNLHGPSGRSAPVVTVWIVLATETFPRFVTAFPSEAR